MALFSTHWYRLAGMKPSLHGHVRLFRHTYRSQTWYVLQDTVSSRQHRFNKTAYFLIGLMDGQRTIQEIWDSAMAALGDEAPTQDEIIGLLGQLHAADVLHSNLPPDILEMFDRQDKQRGRWKQRLTNPFSLRFPLVDPDRFLVRWMGLVKPLLGWGGLLLWLAVVGAAVVLVALNWSELTSNIADRVLQKENLLLLWLVYPAVKLMHELCHAFVTRIWGGEVHEMGLMLLVFTPIPYVDASASAAFPNKHRRMAVAAAGMAIELFIASLALFLWLNIESGRISTIAYNVLLVGGVSTLLFNGNPLLRYDGYYLLADWIEIPNLAQRSSRYLGYLLQRYLFGIEEAVSPVTAPGEAAWFVGYGLAAFFYRLFVLAVLVFFVGSKFFFIGTLIALWAIGSQIVLPALQHGSAFLNSIAGRHRRTRFFTASALVGCAMVLLLFIVPVPFKTRAEGVVTLPEHSRVRAGASCFVSEILVPDGASVKKGEPLISCQDPFLDAQVKVLAANLAEVLARYDALPLQSRKEREILREEVATVSAGLARSRERLHALTIGSPNQGLLVLPDAGNLSGRYVEQGALLGYIMGASDSTVVVVVSQDDIALVRQRTRQVQIRLAGSLGTSLTTTIDRQTPAASDYLPSRALGTTGGGSIPVDPADRQGLRTLKTTFQVEMKLPVAKERVRIGERVYALFDHGYQPLGLQWYRSLRQLFLRRFYV